MGRVCKLLLLQLSSEKSQATSIWKPEIANCSHHTWSRERRLASLVYIREDAEYRDGRTWQDSCPNQGFACDISGMTDGHILVLTEQVEMGTARQSDLGKPSST